MAGPQQSLAAILEQVTKPSSAGSPALVPAQDQSMMAVMMMMFEKQMAMAERRADEERENRRTEEQRRREETAERNKMLLALAGTVLPSLLNKPAMDPFMVKMLESSSNKESMQQFMQQSAAMQQQGMSMFMQQLSTMVGTMGEVQNRMTEKSMEMMEERLARIADKDEGGDESSPWAEVAKAALPMLLGPKAAPVGSAVVDAVARQPPAPIPHPSVPPQLAHAAPAPVEHAPEIQRKVILLQLAMALHLRGKTWNDDKRDEFRRKLVMTVARTEDVARSILTDDQGGLFAALAPAVEAEAPLKQWLSNPTTLQFLTGLIADTIKPGLLAVGQELQRRASAAQAASTPAAAPTPEAIPMRPATTLTPGEPPVLGPETLQQAAG